MRESLGLTGTELFSIENVPAAVESCGKARVRVTAEHDGAKKIFEVIARVDTPQEAEYYRNGGILPYVLRQLAANKSFSRKLQFLECQPAFHAGTDSVALNVTIPERRPIDSRSALRKPSTIG